MRTIQSSELGQEPVRFGDEQGMLHLYDGLQTPVTDDVVLLTRDHVGQIERFAISASEAYGDAEGKKEQTAAQRLCGLQSLIARVDCTVVDGEIVPYEMEDSPSGQGITHTVHRRHTTAGVKDTILEHYRHEVGQAPHVIVSTSRNHGTDDKLIVGEENYSFADADSLRLDDGRLVLVKAIPGVPESHMPYVHLQDRTLAPMLTEGDKHYLQRLGMAKELAGSQDLLRDEAGALQSQAVKAVLGSMALGVSLHLTPEDRRRFTERGTVSASRLARDAERYLLANGAVTEPFHPPIQLENAEGRKNAIMRVFVLLSQELQSRHIVARAIGGCIVARPELIVHGAGNSVTGAVLVQ